MAFARMLAAMSGPGPFARALFSTVLAACHAYVPGRELSQLDGAAPVRRAAVLGARVAARVGLVRRRFDPEEAAARLADLTSVLPDVERTYALLADDASRALLVELFALRVLGADHVDGPVTFAEYAAHRRRLARDNRLAEGTLAVGDPGAAALDRFALDGPAGTPLELHATLDGLASVFAIGQYRHDAVPVAPGGVVIDGGAGWGDSVLWFADLVGDGGRVLGFEFAPGNLRALAENLRLNPALAPRVSLFEEALWNRAGERLSFSDAGQVTAVGEGDREVPTITLDALVEREGLERVDVVKLDVEGAEPQVLEGATETLRALRPSLAVAVYHDPRHLVAIPQTLHDLGLGYRLFLGHAAAGTAETVLFATVRGAGRGPG